MHVSNHLTTNLVRAASSLSRLIDDVLDFSRIEAGKLQFDDDDFDPSETLRDAVELVAEHAAAKGLALTCELPPPAVLRGDSFRLRQVLLNLLGNALKFTATGEIRVDGRLIERGDDIDWEVSIADTGIGISTEQAEIIFESFRQADGSTTRKYGGSGLGLAISREIARAMGGTLEAGPREGGGAVFTLVLPDARRRDASSQLAPFASTTSAARPCHVARCRVLVAEDNDVNRDVIASLLSELGVDVTLAADGREAIEALARAPFDLAFLDLHMPYFDGIDVARFARGQTVESVGAGELEPRSRNLTTPLVALTAAVLRADRARCLEARIDDFVAKPFTRDSLGAALESRCRPRIGTSIDRDALAELVSWIDRDHLERIFQKFESSSTLAVSRILACTERRDLVGLREHAHALRSAAGQLGASELARRLESIEVDADSGEFPTSASLHALRQAVFDAVDELPRAIAEPRPSG